MVYFFCFIMSPFFITSSFFIMASFFIASAMTFEAEKATIAATVRTSNLDFSFFLKQLVSGGRERPTLDKRSKTPFTPQPVDFFWNAVILMRERI